MLEQLKEEVYEANMRLKNLGLAILTWGNASGIDKETGLVAIKPSGVEYDKMKPEDIVILDLNGNIVEGKLRPSSDTPTHLELYRKFPDIGGVVHTHSPYATVFAQIKHGIIPIGTTHADTFYGEIPVTRDMTDEEINGEYELNTGKVIVEKFEESGFEYSQCPAVLVASHGPFTWGKNAMKAVENAYILENVAKMQSVAMSVDSQAASIPMNKTLMDKHFFRKHGKNAYYGQ